MAEKLANDPHHTQLRKNEDGMARDPLFFPGYKAHNKYIKTLVPYCEVSLGMSPGYVLDLYYLASYENSHFHLLFHPGKDYGDSFTHAKGYIAHASRISHTDECVCA